MQNCVHDHVHVHFLAQKGRNLDPGKRQFDTKDRFEVGRGFFRSFLILLAVFISNILLIDCLASRCTNFDCDGKMNNRTCVLNCDASNSIFKWVLSVCTDHHGNKLSKHFCYHLCGTFFSEFLIMFTHYLSDEQVSPFLRPPGDA